MDLVKILEIIVPKIKEYYGYEYSKIIDDAIESCYFYFEEKRKSKTEFNDFMKKYFSSKETSELPFLASAFYDSCPIINGTNIDSKRIIYIRNLTNEEFVTDNKNISKVLHEILHLIKSSVSEYYMEYNELKQRSGISVSTLSYDNKIKEVEIKNLYLEEAINIYDESQIMSLILNEDYKTNSYFETVDLSFKMFSKFSDEIKKALKKSLILGGDDFKNMIGEENFNVLSSNFEKFIKTYEVSFSQLNNPNYINEIKTKRKQCYDFLINYLEEEFIEKCNCKKK